MALATLGGTAILVKGGDHIEISHNQILAYEHAINVKATADERQATNISIHHNTISMLDRVGGNVAIFLLADDSLIERNTVTVLPGGIIQPSSPTASEEEPIDLYNECLDLELLQDNQSSMKRIVSHALADPLATHIPKNPFRAHGGIQIASGCDRIKVSENSILGGWGNGITLGSYLDPADIPTGETEETINKITNEQNEIYGYVALSETEKIVEVPLIFKREDSQQPFDYTNGRFRIPNAEPGEYQVIILDPNYRIESIVPVRVPDSFTFTHVSYSIQHVIEVVKIDRDINLANVLAFITEVTIERNEISHMGLCGIGTPQANLLVIPLLEKNFPSSLSLKLIIL